MDYYYMYSINYFILFQDPPGLISGSRYLRAAFPWTQHAPPTLAPWWAAAQLPRSTHPGRPQEHQAPQSGLPPVGPTLADRKTRTQERIGPTIDRIIDQILAGQKSIGRTGTGLQPLPVGQMISTEAFRQICHGRHRLPTRLTRRSGRISKDWLMEGED